jgi:CheY-like chemotaxis protein
MMIIEDSTEDFEAILRALGTAGTDANIVHSSDGDEALERMRSIASSDVADELPQVILLDLNLPGTDGRDILLEIKADERLRSIPVVVLTTSTNPRDVAECYGNGANGYCVKGSDRATFTETIHAIKQFWLEAAVLPSRTNEAT